MLSNMHQGARRFPLRHHISQSQHAQMLTHPQKPHITSQHMQDELRDTPSDLVGKPRLVLTVQHQGSDDLQERRNTPLPACYNHPLTPFDSPAAAPDYLP